MSHFREHARVAITFPSTGCTKQSFADDCDINQIMRHWRNSGQIVHINETPPTYGDFSNVDDYQAACDSVILAQEEFDNLPAVVRDRMNNDPGRLIAFLSDPKNLEEATSLGLIEKTVPTPAPSGEKAVQADSPPTPPEPVTGSVSGGE